MQIDAPYATASSRVKPPTFILPVEASPRISGAICCCRMIGVADIGLMLSTASITLGGARVTAAAAAALPLA